MVSQDDFPKLGKPADSIKVTNANTGETGYRVGLEVFHQLQCLNLLRMSTYPEHYTKLQLDENSKPDEVRAYLDHCVEVIRTKLMCSSDVSVFTYHDIPGKAKPVPDYESNHVCRNFDKIKQWANENAMPAV